MRRGEAGRPDGRAHTQCAIPVRHLLKLTRRRAQDQQEQTRNQLERAGPIAQHPPRHKRGREARRNCAKTARSVLATNPTRQNRWEAEKAAGSKGPNKACGCAECAAKQIQNPTHEPVSRHGDVKPITRQETHPRTTSPSQSSACCGGSNKACRSESRATRLAVEEPESKVIKPEAQEATNVSTTDGAPSPPMWKAAKRLTRSAVERTPKAESKSL